MTVYIHVYCKLRFVKAIKDTLNISLFDAKQIADKIVSFPNKESTFTVEEFGWDKSTFEAICRESNNDGLCVTYTWL